ncbi:hypothetical protein RJ55_02131 [Drechmeria coniospora]|nr:hypothetical protein RJ55_02131 [Drechmeria coniospora]
MHLSALFLAALPALALGQDPSSSSSSTLYSMQTSTMIMTKTVTLVRAHTVTASLNSTTAGFATGTIGSTAYHSFKTESPILAPSTVPSKGPTSAAVALDASKMALAAVAGIVAVAAVM